MSIELMILYKKLGLIFGIFVGVIVLIAIILRIYASQYIYNEKLEIPKDYRVGVVFGAKLKPNRVPGPYLKDRLDAALDLYFNNKIDVIVLSGERLNSGFNEVDVMEEYILKRGVPIEDTFIDGAGLDTYSTVYRVKNIFGFDKVVYITQNYHLTRAIFLGKLMGVDCVGFNSDRSKYKDESKQSFREVLANIKALLDLSKERKPKLLVDSKDTIN